MPLGNPLIPVIPVIDISATTSTNHSPGGSTAHRTHEGSLNMAVKTWAQLRAAFADNNTGNITAADMRDLIETIASVHFTARVRINGNIDTSPDGLDVTAAWPETGLCHITCPSGF